MPRRRLVILGLGAVAVVAVLAIVVLGGGEEEPELTQAQLVAEGNAVCGRLASANLRLRPPPKPYDVQSTEFFDTVQDNVDDARERLGELNPPPEQQAALDELVRSLELISVKLEQVSGAASVEQDTEVEALIVETRALVREAIRHERALGVCPGKTSTRTSIAAAIVRTRENPLTETGPLIP
jgi:hypothetical protein